VDSLPSLLLLSHLPTNHDIDPTFPFARAFLARFETQSHLQGPAISINLSPRLEHQFLHNSKFSLPCATMNIILLLLLAFVASVTSLVHGNSKLTKHSGVVNRSEPSEVHVAAQYDPNRVASDLDMNNYIAKGNHRGCLLEATDRGAGMLSMDTRSPPSAQSLWQGTLESEYCSS
jgi:hypothetical protein